MPRAREDWTGIYPHMGGWRAVVKRASDPPLRRWFSRGTAVGVMQAWRTFERAKWITEKPKARSGTFRGDVTRYLEHPDVRIKSTYKERGRELAHWTRAFGDQIRSTITEAQIRAIRDRWTTQARNDMDIRPLSAARINKLVGTLRNLWTVLDGRAALNPVAGIEELTVAQRPPSDLTRQELATILAHLGDRGRATRGGTWTPNASKSRARILVLAATGLPAGTLKKLTPPDVDLKRRIIYRPARQKGTGVGASPQPMTQAAVAAFKEFARLDCWGPFSNSSLRKTLNVAVKHAGITRHVKPYDLRHTFLTELAKASKDEVAVMHVAQHSNIETTRKYYTRGSMSERAAAAVKVYEASLKPKKKRAAKKKRGAQKK